MPCDRAPKSLLAGASVVDTSGGRAETPRWPGVHRSYRGPRTGRRGMRVAREPERPCHFRRDCRPGFRLTNSRLIRSSVPSWRGRTEDETMDAAHNAVGLAGESPVVGIDCLPT